MLPRLGWIIATLTLGLLLSSTLRSTNVPVSIATLVLCILAIARPDGALLVAAGFAGLGNILRVFAGISTLRVEEIMVLATLFGWCVRSIFDRRDTRHAFSDVNALPVTLFAVTVVCSAVVWMRVDQVQTGYASAYLAELWRWLSTNYFVDSARFADVVSTAALLESLVLYLAVATMCQRDRTLLDRCVRMLAIGGAAVGVMSIVRIAEIAFRNPGAIVMLQRSYGGLRISPQIPDYIAAASYFALCWTAALGLAVERSRDRILMIVAAVPLLAGLYLTGSRSALGAAACGLAAFAYLIVRRHRLAGARLVIGLAVAALIALAVAFPRLVGHDLAGTTAGESIKMRVLLLKAGAGVLGTHPVFGVGIDRFFLYVDRFASPQLLAMWNGRKNPHNDFVRVATEFGLVGLGLFLWILFGCARRIRDHWNNGGDARLAGLIGGLAAFLVTMTISNPLMVHAVSYVFWIALGLATGESAGQGSPAVEPSRIRHRRIAWAASIVLLATVPLRADRELAATDLSGMTYGLHEWKVSADGVPSRLSDARATLFIASDAQWLDLPVRGALPTGGNQVVQVFVDGRLANKLVVGRDWQHLSIRLTPDRMRRSRRIDLDVSPAGTDTASSGGDRRTLGVEVGGINVVRRNPADR